MGLSRTIPPNMFVHAAQHLAEWTISKALVEVFCLIAEQSALLGFVTHFLQIEMLWKYDKVMIVGRNLHSYNFCCRAQPKQTAGRKLWELRLHAPVMKGG